METSSGSSEARLGLAQCPRRHGAIGQDELQAIGSLSVCELAVGRDPLGGTAIARLTDLPTTTRVRPTIEAGFNRPAADAKDGSSNITRLGDESLEAYLERGLRRASLVVLPNRSSAYRASKRIIDLVGGTLLLGLALPVMTALSLLIRLDSKGSAIFRQQRVTRGGRVFTFYKFRTMYDDAKVRFPELYNYSFLNQEFDASYYKMADDPRNTRVGRWLRRTTLDELPNLINVLKGDLSLVGPRPELPELIYHYPPENLACLFTKAGLTGLAQVAGRSLLTVRERLMLDTRYVANQTLLLDLKILFRTAIVVLTGRGAF